MMKKLGILGSSLLVAGSASAALPVAIETALETGATDVVANINAVAAIGIPVLVGFVIVLGIWKIGRKCLS